MPSRARARKLLLSAFTASSNAPIASASWLDLKIRDSTSVLIGAFDNPWTLRTADQLRFKFRKDSEQDIGIVHDSQHPEKTAWKLTRYWPNWDVPVDYAIVTRMVDTTSDRPVIIAAGLTHYGTIAAGEFLTNPGILL